MSVAFNRKRYVKPIKIIILLVAIFSSVIGIASHPTRAATPSGGTISTSPSSLTWQGQFFAAGVNADPTQCPPNADPNLQCDHFLLNIDLAPDFWLTHTGSANITITWADGSNDFDLYVYRTSDGQLVGSSTAGGGETQEQVMIQSPTPGQYEIRTVPFLVLASAYSGFANLVISNTPPVQNPSFPTGGISFGPATVVDAQRTQGEPLAHIDQAGNVYSTGPWGFSTGQSFLSKSTDGGQTFNLVSSLDLRPNISPAGGGDSDVITDDQGNLYFADLEGLASILVAVSNDGGNNWRTNNFASATPVDDRQWLAIDNGISSSASDNTLFFTYRQVPFGSQILSSPGSSGPTDLNGGLMFQNAADTQFVGNGAPCGRLTFDPALRMLYLPCVTGNHVSIAAARVAPGQRTGLHFNLVATPTSPGGAVGHLFSSLTTDQVGNVYVAWVDSNNNNVYVTASKNTGNTWTFPLQVNGNPANTNVMPWAAAGAKGTVDIVFYGTAVRGDPNSFPSWFNNRQAAATVKWFTYFVQVQNALSATPKVYMTQASEHPTDYGQLCTSGLGCTVSGGDRTLADYFSLAIDKNGAAHIMYNDLTNQHHGAALYELTQTAGPTAFGTTLKGSSNTATGVTDPSGDAQVPHYSLTVPGPNQPALDLLSVRLSQPDPSHLTVTMQVASLASLLPPTGTDGIVWLTRWQFLSTGDGGEESYRIFYAGANVTTAGITSFFAGTGLSTSQKGVMGNGCITNTPQNCKVILYPAEKVETGSINTVNGNITVTFPLADIGDPITGDTLFSVTALSKAFVKGDSLLIDADAARSFDYVMGAATLPTNCPLGTSCKVTGGGYIFVDPPLQDHGIFSIELTVDAFGRVRGKTAYVDQSINMAFRTVLIDSVNFNGNTVTFKGTGTANGVETSYVISVQDNDTPTIGPDNFSITLGTGYSKSGPLAGGDIEIH